MTTLGIGHISCCRECDIGPVCVPMELSLTFDLPQPSVMLIQCVFPCDVDPVCILIKLLSTLQPSSHVMLIQCVFP